ncbi:biotin--[acetyl-CoA-carboxylase] ligase [Carnobacterium funditum]|uniref:biotin--[acetyl-CoA-carboxylase] ligase n=1 Tax=Carnobacterium funditum TaxID=2752 RepID=UPI00054F0A7E|nr:biotin--[acetyl-CoA-carboxylase] ligase [Carnobacterium funditum]
MTTKKQLLTILEQQKGQTISGQDLADCINVSRTSIWKAISTLRKEGYLIEATTNKGYRLSTESDLLSSEAIRPLLIANLRNQPFYVFKAIESTNQEAKKIAAEHPAEPAIILSEEQTKGKGRLGRFFYSPPKTGIYMSLILKPNLTTTDATLVTTAAAVAVCLAIEKITTKKPKIKWVNDIYLDDYKISGILTEAVTNFENGTIDTIILGIGLNFRTPIVGFPTELKPIAGSLLSEEHTEITRNNLIAEIINQFYQIYQDIGKRDFLNDYKERCFVFGKTINFKQGKQEFNAIPIDIDQQGGLVVKMKDGQLRTLSYGEIAIQRPFNQKGE